MCYEVSYPKWTNWSTCKDFQNCLEYSQPCMYADDTHLTFASNNVDGIPSLQSRSCKLSPVAYCIKNWIYSNWITSKITHARFLQLLIQKSMASPSRTKSVGVHIDQNLPWNVHINELLKKIASAIGALKRVRHFVHGTILQYIFNSLIQAYFNYCCVVWDNCNKTHAYKLQKLQNRAITRHLTYSTVGADAYSLSREAWLEKTRFPAKNSQGCHGLQNAKWVRPLLCAFHGYGPWQCHFILGWETPRATLSSYSKAPHQLP